jgi:hypothetical protein
MASNEIQTAQWVLLLCMFAIVGYAVWIGYGEYRAFSQSAIGKLVTGVSVSPGPSDPAAYAPDAAS